MAFHAYLFFGGNCRQAFTRYQEIFGGQLEVMGMADAPEAPEGGVDPTQADLVLHAALIVGDALLMGSDDPTTDDFGPVQGMMVSYTAPDADEARRVFAALAEGGEVGQEPVETFFSPVFAMCVDRFGTPWMVTTDQGEG